jgi:broad specificity phosphatase PhoE
MQDISKEKVVYFVRHGQSVDNAAPVYQHADSPLSLTGQKQAKKVALRVSNIPFDCLITSPQPRAIQTANKISSATGKTPEYSGLFVERIKPKSVNGIPHSDEKATKIWAEWNESLYKSGSKIENGENYEEIIKRADEALNYLANRKERLIMVVTHGYFLRTLISRVLTGDLLTGDLFKEFQNAGLMENTGLSALKYGIGKNGEYGWRLWFYNDHSHLAN